MVGPVQVPAGMGGRNSCRSAIISAGFAVGSITATASTQPQGTVVAATYSYGTVRLAGTPVNLSVSNGSVTVPNVVGFSQTAATNLLHSDGLAAGSVSYVVNPAAPGTVVAQSAAAGTLLASGGAVNLTVSLGQVNVPNVLSWDQGQAESRIVAVGLTVGSVSTTNNCIAPGTVQVQHPSPTTAVAPGSTVDLTVSTCTSTGGGGGDDPPRHEQ